jgi:hypothetical protein
MKNKYNFPAQSRFFSDFREKCSKFSARARDFRRSGLRHFAQSTGKNPKKYRPSKKSPLENRHPHDNAKINADKIVCRKRNLSPLPAGRDSGQGISSSKTERDANGRI